MISDTPPLPDHSMKFHTMREVFMKIVIWATQRNIPQEATAGRERGSRFAIERALCVRI